MVTVTKRFQFDAASGVTLACLDFLGYPRHWVGNDGTVWSQARNWRSGAWKKLTPVPDSFGYLRVPLTAGGKSKSYFVHRLVLTAFVGDCPDGMEARHFPDSTPSNNSLANLSWATPKCNSDDKVLHGTSVLCRHPGESNGQATLTETIVRRIRALRPPRPHGLRTRRKPTLRDITAIIYAEFGLQIGTDTVHLVVERKAWKHLED